MRRILDNPVGASAIGVLVVCLVLGCETGLESPSMPAHAPTRSAALSLPDVKGNPVEPLTMTKGQQAAVLIFVAAECPICNAYAGEINRLSQAYAAKGIVFYLIDVDANVSAADLARHAREYSLAPRVLLDPNHVLAKKFAARVTPEAIVLDRAGSVVYRGRIDDLYIALGQRRFEATTHDLRNAMDALLAGKPAPAAATPAVGCAI